MGYTVKMEVPMSFVDTFGLVPDPDYPKLVKLADNFIPGEFYTIQDIVSIISDRYRLTSTLEKEWIPRMNKAIDMLIFYELIKWSQEDFAYYRTTIQ